MTFLHDKKKISTMYKISWNTYDYKDIQMRQPQQSDNFLNTLRQKSRKVQDDFSQIRTSLSITVDLMDKLIEKDELSKENKNDSHQNNSPSLR